MNNKTTLELFDILTSKLIIELKDNEEICPSCKGLRFTYEEQGSKSFVNGCQKCYTGKVYKCKFCGELNRSDFCNCKQASNKRSEVFCKKEWDKWQEALKTATIVKFKDYKGYLTSLYNEERVVQADEFSEQYLDNFDAEFSPKMVCASVGEPHFTLDIYDIISDKCEDGYEDMYQRLDTESELLGDIQVLMDKWMEENESSLKVYGETNKVLVDLSELYEEELSKH